MSVLLTFLASLCISRQSKSVAAAAMATVMNPNFRVRAHEMFVGTKTEGFFNDAFWQV